MRLKDFLKEQNIYYGFSSIDDDMKKQVLTRDLSNCGLSYEELSQESEDFRSDFSFAFSIPCIDNKDKESTAKHVKRLLLTAGWADLALETSVTLFKRSMYITISKGVTECIVIYVK